MAVIAATITEIKTYLDQTAHIIQWATMLNGDTGSPVEMPGSTVRSVQVQGTFGAGGTMQLKGSNDSTNYIVLTDPQGNSISKTAASIEAIEEITRLVRPEITAGDGTTSLTVTLLVFRSKR